MKTQKRKYIMEKELRAWLLLLRLTGATRWAVLYYMELGSEVEADTKEKEYRLGSSMAIEEKVCKLLGMQVETRLQGYIDKKGKYLPEERYELVKASIMSRLGDLLGIADWGYRVEKRRGRKSKEQVLIEEEIVGSLLKGMGLEGLGEGNTRELGVAREVDGKLILGVARYRLEGSRKVVRGEELERSLLGVVEAMYEDKPYSRKRLGRNRGTRDILEEKIREGVGTLGEEGLIIA